MCWRGLCLLTVDFILWCGVSGGWWVGRWVGRILVVTGMAGSAVVTRTLRVYPSSTRLFVRVNVRYLCYPSTSNRSVRRTYVIRNYSPSGLIGSVGGLVNRWVL